MLKKDQLLLKTVSCLNLLKMLLTVVGKDYTLMRLCRYNKPRWLLYKCKSPKNDEEIPLDVSNESRRA